MQRSSGQVKVLQGLYATYCCAVYSAIFCFIYPSLEIVLPSAAPWIEVLGWIWHVVYLLVGLPAMLYFLFDPSGPFCSSTKAYRSWFFLCPWVGLGFGLLVFAIQPIKKIEIENATIQTTQEMIQEPKNEENEEQVPSYIAPLSSFDDAIENLLDCRACGSPLPAIQEKRRVRCSSCKASWCRACHSKFHLLPTCGPMRLRRRTSSDVVDY